MRHSFVRVVFGALFVALVLAGAPAEAQPARVFISVTGNDANPCEDINTPCRTFTAGINRVGDRGEVIVLTTGSYGGTTITKSVTLDVPNGVVAFAASPFLINAPGATVVLRGLTLKALNVGSLVGINVLDAAAVHVERCVIDSWNVGIQILAAANVNVLDTIVRNTTVNGLRVDPAAARVSVDHSRFENSSDGILVQGGKVSVKNSVLSHNTNSGVSAGCAASSVSLADCLVASNNAGLLVGGGAIGRVSNTIVTDNTTGLFNIDGTLETLGNNTVRGNDIATAGTITMVSLQ